MTKKKMFYYGCLAPLAGFVVFIVIIAIVKEAVEPSLNASSEIGLLGVPLPEGAELTESNPANENRDASETYKIDATAYQIEEFFKQEMQNDWRMRPFQTDGFLDFVGDGKTVAILGFENGGSFMIMGTEGEEFRK